MGNKIDFIVIKTKESGNFISDNVLGGGYFRTKIPSLLFDGETLQQTPKEDWFKIKDLPQTIKQKQPNQNVNMRYELKAAYPISELTPQVIAVSDFDEDDDTAGLYCYKTDTIEGSWEEIEFSIEVLSEEDDFYVEQPKYKGTPSLMTQLTVNPVLHSQRPVVMSGKQFYTIIRNYIKANIDGRYARVSSDFDFCLSVEKVIGLAVTHRYTVDVGTKRKPRLVERFNQDKKVKVFETSPEGYTNYPTQPAISGKNQKDLEEKIDAYLQNLITKINQPLKECPNCGGTGCVGVESN